MALANLKKELQGIIKAFETTDKSGKGSGSNNPLRKYLDDMKGEFKMTEANVLKELEEMDKSIKASSIKTQKTKTVAKVQRFNPNDPRVKKFAKLYFNSLKKQFKSTDRVEWFTTVNTGTEFEGIASMKKGASGDRVVFSYFQDRLKLAKVAIMNQAIEFVDDRYAQDVINEIAEGSATGTGFFDVGHEEAVIQKKFDVFAATATDSPFLSDAFGSQERGGNLVLSTMRQAMGPEGANLPFELNENIDVKVKDGKFVGSTVLEYKPETWRNNQIKGAGTGTIGKFLKADQFKEGTRGIMGALDDLIQKELEDIKQLNDPKEYAKRKGSKTLEDTALAMIVNNPVMRNAYKKGVARNLSRVKWMPTGRDETVKESAKLKTPKFKKVKVKKLLGVLPKPKGKRKNSVEGGASGQDKALEVRAFINSRLTQQVQKNMGRPGLRNQTGRFAQSVNVTNANAYNNRIHMDYSYEQQPYRVFENGNQYPSGYDPRPLIERSIRELAASKLSTKFTLRRV